MDPDSMNPDPQHCIKVYFLKCQTKVGFTIDKAQPRVLVLWIRLRMIYGTVQLTGSFSAHCTASFGTKIRTRTSKAF
jgi:hypothetical protein